MKYFDQIDQLKYYEPTPDIYETLEKLKDAVPISIFTNVKLANTLKTLEAVNINSKWFTYIVSGDDVKNRKPAPDGFRFIIEKSQLSAESILYVGDRVNVDITPANKVGMQSCLLYKKSKEATHSFGNFSDLLQLFPPLSNR